MVRPLLYSTDLHLHEEWPLVLYMKKTSNCRSWKALTGRLVTWDLMWRVHGGWYDRRLSWCKIYHPLSETATLQLYLSTTMLHKYVQITSDLLFYHAITLPSKKTLISKIINLLGKDTCIAQCKRTKHG